MKALSLFTGAGGLDLGLEAAGITTVAMCELDPSARSVLARHWPDVPVHDDITTWTNQQLEEFRGRIDLVAGGSPCQDLSMAGTREGLGGERSALFWHQCRVADQVAAPWVLWENVAGALSSNDGEDFAAVLWGLTGFRPAVPENGWSSIGVCVGERRTAVWRVLDARWFGVAQRRRRVFVVAGPRTSGVVEVLLEPESCERDSRPGVAAGEDVAAAAGGGAGGGSGGLLAGEGVVTALTGGLGSGGPDAAHAQAGWLVPVSDATGPLTAGLGKGPRGTEAVDSDLLIPTVDVVGTLTPGAHPGGVNGQDAYTGQLVPVVPAALSENQRGELRLTGYVRSITSGGGKPGQGYPAVVLPARPAVAFSVVPEGGQGADLRASEVDVAPTLTATGGSTDRGTRVVQGYAVRRLTPRECERLMGWPDDHTRWAADGTEIADSPRYRMIGNGVVAPVAEWIGRRLLEAAS